MSEVSSPIDWACRLIVDRLAQTSVLAPEFSKTGVGLLPFYRKRMESLGFGSIEAEEAMEALDGFVASEMNQLVLVKVLSDAALDNLLVSEQIRHCSDPEKANDYSGDGVIAS